MLGKEIECRQMSARALIFVLNLPCRKSKKETNILWFDIFVNEGHDPWQTIAISRKLLCTKKLL
jgi:hypothetical protein